jgi:hypothetical protein
VFPILPGSTEEDRLYSVVIDRLQWKLANIDACSLAATGGDGGGGGGFASEEAEGNNGLQPPPPSPLKSHRHSRLPHHAASLHVPRTPEKEAQELERLSLNSRVLASPQSVRPSLQRKKQLVLVKQDSLTHNHGESLGAGAVAAAPTSQQQQEPAGIVSNQHQQQAEQQNRQTQQQQQQQQVQPAFFLHFEEPQTSPNRKSGFLPSFLKRKSPVGS